MKKIIKILAIFSIISLIFILGCIDVTGENLKTTKVKPPSWIQGTWSNQSPNNKTWIFTSDTFKYNDYEGYSYANGQWGFVEKINTDKEYSLDASGKSFKFENSNPTTILYIEYTNGKASPKIALIKE